MASGSTIANLTTRLRAAAEAGRAGDRLPSMRQLSSQYRASPVTVARVLAQLVAEGVVTTRPGAGTFVAERRHPLASRTWDHAWQTIALRGEPVDDRGMRVLTDPLPDGAIPLASGYPHPGLTAAAQLTGALGRVLRRPGMWERPPAAGIPSLRRWFADQVGGLVSEDDVLITSGAQAALSVSLRALSPPGAPVLVESPTYPGAIAVARAAGLRPVPVPVDAGGMRTDLLAEAFASTGARVLYCQPTFHNPTGTVLTDERREQLLAVARAVGAFVIEDDWARWLVHDHSAAPPPLIAADVDGHVVHIRSLTKTVAPSLRLGAVIARGPAAHRLRALRLVDDFFVTRPLQEAAAELLASPAWPRHLRALATALRVRSAELSSALRAHAPALADVTCPAGGFYAWVRLPDGTDDAALAERARRAGVMVSAGHPYFVAEPTAAHLRLSFVGTAHAGEMDEGVRRLGSVLG